MKEPFAAFSDIEFNPKKSLNCQARALGLFLSLSQRRLLKEFIAQLMEIAAQYHLYRHATALSEQELC